MPTIAIVANPVKISNLNRVKYRITTLCEERGYDEVLWLETTEDDPGAGQTEQALEAGADVVCAFGGDGTVRAVGEKLVGTSAALGLLPGGTGNLLARNLDLPIQSWEKALDVALNGRNQAIDTGTLELIEHASAEDAKTQGRQRHTFLVMAGIGMDAEVLSSVDEKAKAKIGWLAYIWTGLKHLNGSRTRVSFQVDGGHSDHRHIRTIIFGNVGKLQGGVELLPGASPEDGVIDAIVMSPEGIFGWLATTAQLITRHKMGHKRMERTRGRDFKVVADRPIAVEIDGDPIAEAEAIRITVEPESLVVRVEA